MTELRADPRSVSWFLVSTVWPQIFLLASYLIFIYKVGPAYMKNRKPYELRRFMLFYNLFQILANGYAFYVCLTAVIEANILHLYCEVLDFSDNPPINKMVSIVHFVYMMKIIDLIETIVYVLRKKYNQISVLHVYHHISTIYVTQFFIRYVAHGMFYWTLLINCGVHVVMYAYYLLSAFGPKVQYYLKFLKPAITSMQMLQFIFLILHTSQGFLPSCKVPEAACVIIIGNFAINYILFSQFYKKSYKAKTNKA